MSTRQQIESLHQTLAELGPRQYEVIDELIKAEPHGMSAWELSEKIGRMIHALRPRITELKGMGHIYQSGERFCRMTNRHEAVWRVMQPSGQTELF